MKYGTNGKLLEAVRAFYEKSKACARMENKLSGWFQVTRSRQGCVMTTWHFSISIEKSVREAQERFAGGVQLETTTVKLVLFTMMW